MKKYLFLVVVVVLIQGFVSCSKDDGNNDLSVDPKPTWTVVTEGVVPQGMYITMDAEGLPLVDGKVIAVNSGDILGAFIGGECRGLAKPIDEIDGKTHFYLKVRATESDEKDAPVSLRYYSTEKQHVFYSEQFSFVADGEAGSLEEGFKPNWK